MGVEQQEKEKKRRTMQMYNTIQQLVDDGISTKINKMTDESQLKLQETMQKIINDSNGGIICIII